MAAPRASVPGPKPAGDLLSPSLGQVGCGQPTPTPGPSKRPCASKTSSCARPRRSSLHIKKIRSDEGHFLEFAGFGARGRRNQLRDLLASFPSDIICLQETKKSPLVSPNWMLLLVLGDLCRITSLRLAPPGHSRWCHSLFCSCWWLAHVAFLISVESPYPP